MEFPPKSPGNIQHWTFDAAAAAPMLSSLPLFLFIVHCCCRCKRKLQLPHNLFNALLQMQCVLLCSSSSKQAGSSPWLVPWILLAPPATRGSPPSEENVSHTTSSGKGSEKKSGLLPNQGGGSEGSKKTNLYFGKVLFQWAWRIILGPQKHILHLVPSRSHCQHFGNIWSVLNM